MKKDRNAFFQNQSASSYFYPTNAPVNAPMNQGMMGYPMATESSSNFYQGPIMTPVAPQESYSTELESRLAKIERSINRLDTRLSKLESELPTSKNNTILENEYTSNNMYMI